MSDEESQLAQEGLRGDLTSLRALNERLSELLDEEADRRESAYRIAEDIPEPEPGTLTNLDVVAKSETGFEHDLDERQEVDACIEEAEDADPISVDDLNRVRDAITARVVSLSDEMERNDIDRITQKLGEDFDVSFLS